MAAGPRFIHFFWPVIDAVRDLGGSAKPREVVDLVLEGGEVAFENLSYGPFFSPDSQYLLTTREQRPRLWDLETRTDLGTFPVDEGLSTDATLGDQALLLATGVGDYALLRNLNTDEWFDIACQAAGRNFTPEEWAQFGPKGEPHRATCEQWQDNALVKGA